MILQSGEVPKAVAVALRDVADNAQHEVLIESAYLIPGDAALDLLSQLHRPRCARARHSPIRLRRTI